VFYYQSRTKDDRALRLRLKELAYARPRYGYRGLTILLQREGWPVNHKRIHRIYREEGLMVRTKRRKKRAAEWRVKLLPATRVGERWSIDFMSDQLADGRKFRVFAAVDHVSRECIGVEVGQSLPSQAVTEALDRAIGTHGKPEAITMDNVLTSESSLPRRETLPWGRPLMGSFWISGQLWPCGLPLAM